MPNILPVYGLEQNAHGTFYGWQKVMNLEASFMMSQIFSSRSKDGSSLFPADGYNDKVLTFWSIG